MSRRITSRHVETLGAQSVAECDDFRPKIIETWRLKLMTSSGTELLTGTGHRHAIEVQ